MDDAMLRADCQRCAGLCCVALAFDRSSLFAFDKQAGEPCRHLQVNFRCGIHSALALRGFAGCATYDCAGAGQRVTQEVFGGRSWRHAPELLRPMLEAFRALRTVHESILLLRQAGHLQLSPRQSHVLSRMLLALQPADGWSLRSLMAFERGPLPGQIAAFLTTLKTAVGEEGSDACHTGAHATQCQHRNSPRGNLSQGQKEEFTPCSIRPFP